MFTLYKNISKDLDIKQKTLEYRFKCIQKIFPPEFSAILVVHAVSLTWL